MSPTVIVGLVIGGYVLFMTFVFFGLPPIIRKVSCPCGERWRFMKCPFCGHNQ